MKNHTVLDDEFNILIVEQQLAPVFGALPSLPYGDMNTAELIVYPRYLHEL